MEKTVMVLNVEDFKIKVSDGKGGQKEITKANVLVTDGSDRFIGEAFDLVADEIVKDQVKGKLCGINCKMEVREWEKDGRKGESNQIRVLSCKSFIDEAAKQLEKEKNKEKVNE